MGASVDVEDDGVAGGSRARQPDDVRGCRGVGPALEVQLIHVYRIAMPLTEVLERFHESLAAVLLEHAVDRAAEKLALAQRKLVAGVRIGVGDGEFAVGQEHEVGALSDDAAQEATRGCLRALGLMGCGQVGNVDQVALPPARTTVEADVTEQLAAWLLWTLQLELDVRALTLLQNLALARHRFPRGAAQEAGYRVAAEVVRIL